METIGDLMAKLDALAAMPVRERVAEQLTLFRSVASALRTFVEREQALLPAIRRLRPLAREMSERLMEIEASAGPSGPSEEHVKAYYGSLVKLQAAVREIEQAAQPRRVPRE